MGESAFLSPMLSFSSQTHRQKRSAITCHVIIIAITKKTLNIRMGKLKSIFPHPVAPCRQEKIKGTDMLCRKAL
jgi:hypothetical protein